MAERVNKTKDSLKIILTCDELGDVTRWVTKGACSQGIYMYLKREKVGGKSKERLKEGGQFPGRRDES